MAIEISSLTQISPEKIEAMVATLTQLMAEKHPEVELTRGVFHDLILYFDGVLNAAIQENIDRLRQSQSLLKIAENPELADGDAVDQVLSNYNIVRDAGTAATGSITVVFNLPVQTNVPATLEVTSDTGVSFSPPNAFVVVPPDGTITDTATQRKMMAVGDGTYAAAIPVFATTVGAAGNIRKGARLTVNSVLNNALDVYASSDFIGGKDPSTNTEYLSKLAPALTAKTLSSRKSYAAAILNEPAFANTLDISVVGAGDPEQQRDQHSLFPISGGGKVDIYVQTAPYAQEQERLMSATYIGPAPVGSRWQIVFERNLAPGFYEVTRIANPQSPTSSGYGIVLDSRNADFTDLSFVPDVLFVSESAYTRYQTVTIQFDDTDTPTTGLVAGQNKKVYAVTTIGMPFIGDIQDFITSRDNRPRGTDVLVKAAIPCFTKVAFEIRRASTDNIPDIAAIQNAVSAAISGIGFTGQLPASVISAAAHKYLSGKQALSEIDMFGRIRRPDGSTAYVRNSTVLTLPNDVTRLVTSRTTAFLTSPQDVSVSVVNAGF